MRDTLNGFDLTQCVPGNKELILDRETRKRWVENIIRASTLLSPLKKSLVRESNNTEVWGSDRSMRPAVVGPLDDKVVTCAITGP